MKTVTFERLRQLRDLAGQLRSPDLVAALEELVHLRAARVRFVDGVQLTTAADLRVIPEHLKPDGHVA